VRPLASPALAQIEIAAATTELTRGELILKGALAAGAVYGAAAIGPFTRRALAATDGGDLEILDFLLPFEYLQVAIYERAADGVNSLRQKLELSQGQRQLIEVAGREERQHLGALTDFVSRLGGKPVAEKVHDFFFVDAYTFFGLAGTLELSTIGIYNYLLPEMKADSLRKLAASIVQVEGRHSAAIRLQREEEPTLYTFDSPLARLPALNTLEKFTP
jgi:hypothetical protein